MFFPRQWKMTPTWLPWILIGGICFIVFGFIGSKYKDKSYQKVQFLQDFVSGSILITLVGIVMPDFLPEISLPATLPSMGSMSSSIEDELIQVGPPRLMGR